LQLRQINNTLAEMRQLAAFCLVCKGKKENSY
jgi:hypothetical protein